MKKEEKARILLHAMSEMDERYIEEAAAGADDAESRKTISEENASTSADAEEAAPSEAADGKSKEKTSGHRKETSPAEKVRYLKPGRRRGVFAAAAAAAVVLVFGAGLYLGSSGITTGTSSLMLADTAERGAAANDSLDEDYTLQSSHADLSGSTGSASNFMMRSSAANDSLSEDTGGSYASEGSSDLTDSVDTDAIPDSRKLIRTVNLSFETTDLDAFVDELTAQTKALGGYVESSDVSGNESIGQRRNAYLTLRIPTEQLDDFLTRAEGEANLTRRYESTQDITLQYHDTESRRKAIQTEYDRLLELMAQADSVDTVIAIEQRLSDLRYQLDSYTSDLRLYDNEVDYATVTVDISETTVLSPTEGSSFRQRVLSRLAQNLEDLADAATDFAVWFLSALPFLLVIGVVGFAVYFIARRIRKRRKKRGGGIPKG